jgi:hypothetical protein
MGIWRRPLGNLFTSIFGIDVTTCEASYSSFWLTNKRHTYIKLIVNNLGHSAWIFANCSNSANANVPCVQCFHSGF